MINHAFSVLYGSPGATQQLWSGLTSQSTPDVITGSLPVLRGSTPEQAASFAVSAVKLLDASTFRAVLWQHDTRMTLQPHELAGTLVNARELVDTVLGAPSPLIQYALSADEDFQDGYGQRSSPERAAAVLAGLVVALSRTSA